MDPEIKRRWVAALRSGQYKQGRDRLKDFNRYCCLGVLVDLADKDKSTDISWADAHGHDALPRSVAKWAGTVINPRVTIPHQGEGSERLSHSLGYLNDFGYSFNEIADLIEEQL